MPAMHTLRIGAAALLFANGALANEAAGTGEVAGDFPVAALETQLRVGEHADVAAKATRQVEAVEARHGRYHPTLIDPLRLLGDAHLGQGDADAALAAYDRAKHIVRIDAGVQGLAQLPLLYREADALVAAGRRGAANDRHELAYSLKLRAYGERDPQLIPGLDQLIDWYRHHYKFRPAQLLYEHSLELLREDLPPDDPRIIATLRDYAGSFREQRFGARQPGRGGFRAWPPGHPEDPPWYGKSSFLQGRRLLREVLALTEAADHTTDVDVARAAVALADWHLLHYEYATAIHQYRRAWRLLEAEPALRAELFEKPTPLNLRLPRGGTGKGGDGAQGVVRLALNITHRGDVIGRRTLAAEPRNRMEFRVRKAAKETRYRPWLKDGEPTPRRNLELEYRYHYRPGDSALALWEN